MLVWRWMLADCTSKCFGIVSKVDATRGGLAYTGGEQCLS